MELAQRYRLVVAEGRGYKERGADQISRFILIKRHCANEERSGKKGGRGSGARRAALKAEGGQGLCGEGALLPCGIKERKAAAQRKNQGVYLIQHCSSPRSQAGATRRSTSMVRKLQSPPNTAFRGLLRLIREDPWSCHGRPPSKLLHLHSAPSQSYDPHQIPAAAHSRQPL